FLVPQSVRGPNVHPAVSRQDAWSRPALVQHGLVRQSSQAGCSSATNARSRALIATLPPPLRWIDTDDPAKDPCEMRLIAHSQLEGDLSEGCRGAEHQRLGAPDALFGYIGQRRYAEALPESAEEVAVTECGHAGQVRNPDVGTNVGRNIL